MFDDIIKKCNKSANSCFNCWWFIEGPKLSRGLNAYDVCGYRLHGLCKQPFIKNYNPCKDWKSSELSKLSK